MLHRISAILAKKVFGENEENIEIYIYGIELFISSMFCTLLLLMAGIITNSIIESIIFIISFSALRIYTGGYHSNSYISCTIITISIYYMVLLSSKLFFNIISNKIVYILVFIVTIAIVVFLTPVDNSNKHLNKSKILNYKLKAIVVSILEIAINLIFYQLFHFHKFIIIIPILVSVDILIILPVILKNKGEIKNGITH